jgi:xylulokinase
LAERFAPQADDPVFLPHLGGRVSPAQPDLRGAWVGLTWSHTAAHLYRAVLEGVALEYCIYRDVLRELNPELKIREMRITGGGERSSLWNQIKADALGIRVAQVTRQEGAPMGAALLAGSGVGLLKNLDSTARDWIQTGNVVRPDRKLAKHYGTRLSQYKRLIDLMGHWTGT